MPRLRVFSIPVAEGSIVFVPGTEEVFLVDSDYAVPPFIDGEPNQCHDNIPCLKFKAGHLIINNFCNLRCTYCYAGGEFVPKPTEMPLEIAEATINKVIADAREAKSDRFAISLIGGEPTVSFDLSRRIIDYAYRRAEVEGMLCVPDIVTNGIFDEQRRNWIIENFEHVTISMDGHRDIHDQTRRHADGRGSFEEAFANAQIIHKSKVRFGIRITVSSLSVELLPDIVRYFHSTFPGRRLGIEPLEECGRCESTGVKEPDPMEYARQFVRAFQVSTEMSGHIKNSVTRFKYGNSTCYCGANGHNFAVNYEGNVTSCTRVTCQNHPASSMFYYGRYDHGKRGFNFNAEAYTGHSRYIVQSIPECADCFAQFSCKGGCLHLKSNCDLRDFWRRPLDPERCKAMRYITTGLFRIKLGLPID